MVHVPAGTSWTGPFSLQENYDLAFSPVSHCATDLHLQLGYNPVMIDLPGFFIDRREATVSEYDACVRAGDCTPAPRGPEFNSGKRGRGAHPVDGVTADQAIAYCAWKNKRLPSSDEWEKAARGFYGRRFVTGHDRPTCDDVRWRGCPGEPSTTPAGKNPRDVSAFGVHDMMGNVAEWTTYVEDGLNDEYRARGGAIDSYDVDSLQAHYIEGSDHTGIRCARDAR
jgi:formylglycine-generating enzyme required for sulfatase activity